MLFAGASNREIIRQFATLTTEKIIRSKFPSIALIRRKNGEEKTEKALAVLLADSAMAFGEELSPEQALYFASEISSEFYFLTFEECFIVLQKLKKSKLYGKLCLNTFLTAFDDYANERMKIIERINYNEHSRYKQFNPKYYENVFEELADKKSKCGRKPQSIKKIININKCKN